MSHFSELVPLPEGEIAYLNSLQKNKKQLEEIRLARECLKEGILVDIDFVRNFYGTAYRIIHEFCEWSEGTSASSLTRMYIQEPSRKEQKKMLTRLQRLLAMNHAQWDAHQRPAVRDRAVFFDEA